MSLIQREYYRVPLEVPVSIEIPDGRVFRLKCLNISMGGMCLSFEKDFVNEGHAMVVVSHSQSGRAIEFRSKFSVAWSGANPKDGLPRQVGIQFVDIDPENRSKLAQIICARLMEIDTAVAAKNSF